MPPHRQDAFRGRERHGKVRHGVEIRDHEHRVFSSAAQKRRHPAVARFEWY
jgi:hypothetical protein